MPNSNISGGIYAGLIAVAQMFVTKMFARIDANRLPGVIKTATSIGQVKQSANSSSIDIEIDLKTAPMAAAFEWGSGIHRERGNPDFYPITPVNAKKLAIPRSRWTNYAPPPDVDPVILMSVAHPGVASRPYITTTLVEIMPEARKKLAQEIKAAILIGTEKVSYIKA